MNFYPCSVFLFFAVLAAQAHGQTLPLKNVKLPPGFEINVYASNVPNARSLTLSPNGTLFVGSRSEGNVSYKK